MSQTQKERSYLLLLNQVPLKKEISVAMGEMRLGVGQGNNHPVKITDSDFKNLNIFKKKKK